MSEGSRILLTALLAALLASPGLAGDVVLQLGAGDALIIKDRGALERLRMDEDTGNISRDGTLFLHSTGSENTFVGAAAGAAITSGSGNAAFGRSALTTNTSGISNPAFGVAALYYDTTGGLTTIVISSLSLSGPPGQRLRFRSTLDGSEAQLDLQVSRRLAPGWL